MGIELQFEFERDGFRLSLETQCPAAGITALFGRSGSGKTTLLRCIAGLEPGARGHLRVNGETWQDTARFLPPHRRPLGFVFQEGRLFPHLSVRDNLEYGYRRIPRSQRTVHPGEMIEWLELGTLLGRRGDELSGGQRQRVALARALLTSPRLLLMDEPLAALDAASKAEILPYLERLHDELAIPALFVSHVMDEVTRLADHLLLLEQGRLRAAGPLQTLLTRGDLPLARANDAVSLVEAVVEGHDDEDHLSTLALGGLRLYLPRLPLPTGRRVRLGIHARDVSIALAPPRAISMLNCLAATVREVHAETRPGEALVRLDLGGQPLLARLTMRSLRTLDLRSGMPVHALIKSVALIEGR